MSGERRSDARALATRPSNRSSHSKSRFASVRVSCEIQTKKRARAFPDEAQSTRPPPPLLFAVVRTQRTTDGGTADQARALHLAPADPGLGGKLPVRPRCCAHWVGRRGENARPAAVCCVLTKPTQSLICIFRRQEQGGFVSCIFLTRCGFCPPRVRYLKKSQFSYPQIPPVSPRVSRA